MITVMYVGNPLMGDDGIGPAIARALTGAPDEPVPLSSTHREPQSYGFPGIELVDGGTSGMELLPAILDSEELILLDAVSVAGAKPGDVVVLEGDQIPRLRSTKLSPHQVGLLDLLSAAKLMGYDPSYLAVVGVVPEKAELGVGLTPVVEAAIEPAAETLKNIISQRQ
ncbi:HyaD/HybD family hydrogenase maturation endopeptidase [Corynebacterium pyruviciproducens]|uniref:HyaD/HybD family hydrogenase maturation endopeptidase n=1 Tax=Corynebacterium pyruviciproducens TaxID=598660 RepID=A0AAF0YXV6_9CORY|nr:HyaD/HybD family hydrogenase maturation endopeptidase [Corynebacterium pyruviciproducens]MDH4659247.1 HyaD/HybD family hydrogenase maturation endopeptidase [Corynebacterium pyruviciproducens]MDK6564815.1 HyaD/HybD family hydrogenase maturation endopeptidase [Corynebacterium pyruviciproducens]MDK7215486.1 HyaD/HybD family hydrogenase maturation endopeptidase [Corynebacterium pyruviciproducens]WOT02520.1 HyaD/HybD family hydrogenase maturation endopeptidase [Corynebacterium pyruviciproducens]